ncbi:hypothetical protein D3C72_1298790 [compost metagenome]
MLRDVETLTCCQLPPFKLSFNFILTTAQLTGNHKVHIFSGMCTLVMLFNISEGNIWNCLETLTISIDIFTKLLLNLRPKNTVMIIEVAS